MVMGTVTHTEHDGDGLRVTSIDTIRILYRCARCKAVARKTFSQTQNRTTTIENGRIRNSDRFEFQRVDAETGEPIGEPIVQPYVPAHVCADCTNEIGRRVYMRGRHINGKFSEAVECGIKCVSAFGDNCICSCSGANHGRLREIPYEKTA